MLDYRIYTFLTLYKELNYRRTAEKLKMTQPGVTQHIQFLEKYYSTKLFTYKGRTLNPTEDAVILHNFLNRVIAEEKSLPEIFTKQDKVKLKVGATKTIGEFVILDLVEEFIKNENHSIDLIIDNTKVLLEKIEKLEIDFALIEGNFDKSEFDYHLFKREEVVGICSKDHPFSYKKVDITEVFKESIFLREEGSGTRGLIEDVFTERGYSIKNFKRNMTVSSFKAIQEFVSEGLGITFAYKPVVDLKSNLSYFKLKENPIIREFNFVYLNKLIAVPKINKLFPNNKIIGD